MTERKPKKKFKARRWTIIDGKRVELEPVVFHLRKTGWKRPDNDTPAAS